MHINLNDLLAKATVKTSGLVKRPVKWEHKGEDGKTVTDVWDIFIVKDVTFAASDRIYLGDIKSQDSSKNARLISERVRFGENGEETITTEQACALEPSLGWALAMAVHDLDNENAPKDPAKTFEPGDEIWHELVLNGIGGRTIQEAKESMTLKEYSSWVKYRHLRGTLSTPRRLEQAVARACHIVSVAAGLKKDSNSNIGFVQLDFMPHEEGYAELNEEPTIDDWVQKMVAMKDITSQVNK